MYDMKEIERNEAAPEGLLEESEFSLPEDDFGDLLRKKDELNKGFVAPQTSGGQSAQRKKQRESGMYFLWRVDFITVFSPFTVIGDRLIVITVERDLSICIINFRSMQK